MSLASRAMLVSLNQRCWQAQTTDRYLASELEVNTEAQNRTMRVLKQLAPSDYILPIKRIAMFGREQHEKMTLPGFQRGQHLLATKLFDNYTMCQSEIRDQFTIAVKKFCEIYPEIVESGPRRLGKAFRAADFPTPSRIPHYFSYELRFFPVPETGNWLVDDVDYDEMDKLRNQVENEKNAVFRDAARQLMERVTEALSSLAKQAEDYPDDGPSYGKLRDATLRSVKEMAVLLPAMNITGDPVLNAIGEEMQKRFAHIEAKSLRENKAERTAIAATANRILEKMRTMA